MDKQNVSEVKIAQNGNEGVVEAYVNKARTVHLGEDMNILCAECIDLKEENRQLKDSNVQTNNQLRVRDQEVIDLKKTISKMKQEHEAEIRELGDELMEAKAEANAVRKSKEDAMDKYYDASNMLDDDQSAFEAIIDLARIARSVSESIYTLSKRIEAEAEEHI